MDTKQQLRKKLLAQRNKLTPQQCKQAALAVCTVVSEQQFFRAATDIAFYFSVNNELDTLPLLQTALQQGKKCYLPILDEASKDKPRLLFLSCNKATKMRKNKFGILEPVQLSNDLGVSITDLSIIFLPLVGFDAKGNRLGMGAGYYDHTLAELCSSKISGLNHKPALIGLAYACQEVAHITAETWDVPLTGVATELGLQMFNL